MRTFLILSTFFAVIGDVFWQLSEKLADLALPIRVPLLLGAVLFAILIGTLVAHTLLSLVRGTNLLTDLVQEEPVEQLVK